jgi:CubicO group peptidase (beta-lactamase class C family)
VTLGALVAAVARRPYTEHLRRHVLAPAGMWHTEVRTYRPVDVRGLAHPYAAFTADGQPVPPGPGEPPADAVFRDIGDRFKGGSPAGGALSTVGDMIAFSRALLGHRLLSPAMTATVLAGKVDLPGQGPRPAARYAYGFVDRTINGVRMVGHNGGTPGYEGELTMFPGSGHAVVLLTNRDGSLRPAMRWVEERMIA